jgi:hypothetical protein
MKLENEQCYEHVPKLVETSPDGTATILWTPKVQTDRTISVSDNGKETRMLTYVAISGDENVIKNETENILKYKGLTTEIQRMWNVKTKVIPE